MIKILALAGACVLIGAILLIRVKTRKSRRNDKRRMVDLPSPAEEINNSDSLLSNKQNINDEKFVQNAQKMPIPKILDESSYLKENGLIKNEVQLPNIVVGYYNGYPKIDLKGIVKENKFYMWLEEDILHLLDTNFTNSSGLIQLHIESIMYFTKVNDDVTMVNFRYGESIGYMFLDGNAYKALFLNIPGKEQRESI